MTYLDYQATTPLAPEVFEAMVPWLRDQHANPHSPHREGRRAKAAVEVARGQVAAALGVTGGRLLFTSGATEAANWAIAGTFARIGAERPKVVTISTEHACVLDTVAALGAEVVVLPVGPDGLVDRAAAQAAIDGRTAIVAAMRVNNEIGVVQPVDWLGELARAAGAIMFCDAVQGLGRVDLPVDACDLIAVSGHKVYGPKGVGALWVRDGMAPAAILHGGGQEGGLRSGTLSPALCLGFGVAATLLSEEDRMQADRLWRVARTILSAPDWVLNGSEASRWHGNLNVRMDGLDVARLMSECRDIAFSAGSACSSGSGRSSHVLRALGLAEREARSSIRIGFGRYTQEEDLVRALQAIDRAARGQR